jgi:hypothetical protein
LDEKIVLYHGSIHEFDIIDVSRGKPYKDFGAGFYLSPSKEHAENLARRNRHIEFMRIKQRKKKTMIGAWVYMYEFDLSHLNKLKTKEFHKPDGEWMRFVVANRNSVACLHDYDMVIGPTANDDTRASIQAFFTGVFGDVNSDSAIDFLISLIEPYQLPIQYFFGTQRAADLLVFKERIGAV